MMNHYIFSLIFIIVSLHSIAMDVAEKKPLIFSAAQQKSEHTTSINKAINEAIQNSSLCCGLLTKSFLERDHFDLLRYVDSCYPKGICEHDIDRLKKKNHFFAETIHYFSGIAKKNYAAVTLSTLNIITDHHQTQPTKELNDLSPEWRKYVMEMAYHRLRRVHSIEFAGHTAPVRRAAINCKKNLASSASKDGTFRLWDLETGKPLCIFPEKAVSGYVTFNDDGTLLATATLSQENPFTIDIKIWNTDSQQILWHIEHHHQFAALAFFQNETGVTLAILSKNNSTLYALKKDLEPIWIGNNMQCLSIAVDKGHRIKKRKEDNVWIAEKSAPCLYLLERAIENTPAPTIINIHKSPLYKKLVQSEKDIIDTMFKAKFLATYTSIN